MNKKEFVGAIAEKVEMPKKDVEKVTTAVFDVLKEALANGESVQILGFGSFKVGERGERDAKNPATGETIHLPATKVPKFTASKDLKECVK